MTRRHAFVLGMGGGLTVTAFIALVVMAAHVLGRLVVSHGG
jgi:hypothetical protein